MKKINFIKHSLLSAILTAIAILMVAGSCKDQVRPDIDKPDSSRSGTGEIVKFDIDLTQFPDYYKVGDKIESVIVPESDSVHLTVPWYVTSLIRPTIEVSQGATVAPISGSVRDFSEGGIVYTVRAENGEKREWKVYVSWLDEPEPPRDNDPRHPLEETDRYKIHKFPTYCNAYINTDAWGAALASGASVGNATNGITWTGDGTTSRISIFFTARYHGELQLALRGRSGGTADSPDNRLNVKVYVNGVQASADGMLYDHTYTYGKLNQNTDTLTLHRVILPEIPEGSEAHSIRIDMGVAGPRNGSQYYFRFPELWVSGWATRGTGGYDDTGLNWVPSSNASFGRRGPSVHLKPEKPAGNMEYFYSEIFIPEGQDVLGSYFMCNGFGEGYAGIQVNSATERRILFSVWSAYTTDDPSMMGKYAPKLVRVNNQPAYRNNFAYQKFGGEGSGGQSYLKYMWPAGKTLKILTRARPHPQPDKFPNSSLYKAWFHNGSEWIFIAEWRRIELDPADNNGVQPTTKWYTNAHHFLENFNTATGHLPRYGTWNNDWYIGTDGAFYECTNYTFTNDATAQNRERIDYAGGIRPAGDPQAGAAFLKMGGYFTNNVPGYTQFVKTAAGNRPAIDFAALNAMGTDDPNEDNIIDPGEKYEE
ncbi:MAG: DUF3472 domain-containing protein [Tannerellaceae bacterium]|jgi:hypothetical protein|nr:DUF3472 domain-containing protein [Tannerellaceae bacterium]